jgi:ribosomal protein S6
MSEKEVVYELAYVLRVGESETALDEVLKSHGATVKTKSPVSSIQLAYPIKKQEVGQFGYYHLTFKTGDAVKELTEALQLKEGVLRFLMVKVPKTKPRSESREPRVEGATTAVGAAAPKPSVDRIDSLSNEKLSQTLEEILK